MSDESTSGTDVPVGDMAEQGQTDLGPHPSLTHLENLKQANLEAVAEETETTTDADS